MPRQPSAVAIVFCYAMIGVGVLMVLLSDGRTLVALCLGLTERGAAGLAITALLVGLPFIAIGVRLFFGGRSLSRRRGGGEPPDEVF